MTQPLFKDPLKPVDERVKDLLNRMTIEEKILQLTSIWLSFDPEKGEMAPTIMGDDLDKNAGRLDIDYYLRQNIDDDKLETIYDYFRYDAKSESLSEAVKELGPEYTEEEVRLVRIKFLVEVAN